uniref:Uncharacterized protein n=1 Tax=Opuntia streptacantha TaxID=393608 RepID=A0A7C9D5F1_OPUST
MKDYRSTLEASIGKLRLLLRHWEQLHVALLARSPQEWLSGMYVGGLWVRARGVGASGGTSGGTSECLAMELSTSHSPIEDLCRISTCTTTGTSLSTDTDPFPAVARFHQTLPHLGGSPPSLALSTTTHDPNVV